jgi:hypothetical protein
MEKDKIRKVTCKSCKAQHNYRKPQNIEGVQAVSKPTKRAKSSSAGKSQQSSSRKWNQILMNYDIDNAQTYNMGKDFETSTLIKHSSFGIGVITKKIDQGKIEVQFENEVKLLVINKN